MSKTEEKRKTTFLPANPSWDLEKSALKGRLDALGNIPAAPEEVIRAGRWPSEASGLPHVEPRELALLHGCVGCLVSTCLGRWPSCLGCWFLLSLSQKNVPSSKFAGAALVGYEWWGGAGLAITKGPVLLWGPRWDCKWHWATLSCSQRDGLESECSPL